MSKGVDLSFFATNAEIRAIVEGLHRIHNLYAIPAGLFDDSVVPICEFPKIPALAEEASLKRMLQPYLIGQSLDFAVQEIPQRRGGVKYAVNMIANPTTWYFVSGGEIAKDILVPGRFAKSQTDVHQEIGRDFRSALTNFSQQGPFLVSPCAKAIALDGGRLVANGNPESPREYDLAVFT